MGAWIETLNVSVVATLMTSHPIWVRGLKLVSDYICKFRS